MTEPREVDMGFEVVAVATDVFFLLLVALRLQSVTQTMQSTVRVYTKTLFDTFLTNNVSSLQKKTFSWLLLESALEIR